MFFGMAFDGGRGRGAEDVMNDFAVGFALDGLHPAGLGHHFFGDVDGEAGLDVDDRRR